jgi:hypothetical protein
VKLHHRPPELSREVFQRGWQEEHAALVVSKPATHTYVRRYAQLHTVGAAQDAPEGSLIDGISVLAFGSVNDLEDYLVTTDYTDIKAHQGDARRRGLGSEPHSITRPSTA